MGWYIAESRILKEIMQILTRGCGEMDFDTQISNLESIRKVIMDCGVRGPNGGLMEPFLGWVQMLEMSIAKAKKWQRQGKKGV